METKKLKITIPEGFEIDKENSSFEKIVFKKIDTKPRSWEEYCHQQQANNKTGYYIKNPNCSIGEVSWYEYLTINNWRNVLPSRELAEAFLAMMQLMSLREAWIEDWQPAWDGISYAYCVVVYQNKYDVVELTRIQHLLSFPTEKMAEEFIDCFKDLLEVAKPLI